MHRWYNKNISLTLDITTYCNAKCPQCSRTDNLSGGLKLYSNIPLVHWTINQIKSVYTKEQLKNVRNITFSPSWGDPMMNPDAYEIIDHLLECLPRKANLTNITNGSMRNEEFWWKLGGLAVIHRNKTFTTVFDIDGIDQEMHSLYRRNTKLQNVLNNMKAFNDNGSSNTFSQTIIFKHNQDYMSQIDELSKKYGSQKHTFVKSDRFQKDKNGNYKPYIFLDENGKEVILEWADKPWKNAHISLQDEQLKKEITCKWAIDNNLNINFDGQVWPCCYVGAMPYSQQKDNFNNYELIKEYNLNPFFYNIKYTSIDKIIESLWFTKSLQKTIANDPMPMCKKQCSTQIRSLEQFQLRMELE